MDKIKEGDYITLVATDKRYLIHIIRGRMYNTKNGSISAEDIINKIPGEIVNNIGIFKPTIEDIIMYGIKRKTQIIYPKEASLIQIKLNLQNGMKVFECGTGSGAMSIFFINAISPDGILYTYDREISFQENAKENLKRFGFYKNVKFISKDINEGIEEKDFDAAFLDVKEPWKYIELMKNVLKPSSNLGIIVPTTNQVSRTLKELKKYFIDIEVIEILTRKYKINPDRLRPEDIMVGHTGYLIFTR